MSQVLGQEAGLFWCSIRHKLDRAVLVWVLTDGRLGVTVDRLGGHEARDGKRNN